MKFVYKYWKQRGISYEKPHKLWGFAHGFFGRFHIKSVLRIMYNKYRDDTILVGFYAWIKPLLLILNLESITNILDDDKRVTHQQQHLRRKTSLLWDLHFVQELYSNCLEENLQKISTKQSIECNISESIEQIHCKILNDLLYPDGDDDEIDEEEKTFNDSDQEKTCDLQRCSNRNLFKGLVEKLSCFRGQITFLYPLIRKFYNRYHPYNIDDIGLMARLINEQYLKGPERYRFLHDIITNGNVESLQTKPRDCLECMRIAKDNDDVSLLSLIHI